MLGDEQRDVASMGEGNIVVSGKFQGSPRDSPNCYHWPIRQPVHVKSTSVALRVHARLYYINS